MSRTETADRIRDSLLAALRNYGASVRAMSDLAAEAVDPSIRKVFESLGRADREVYFVPDVGFINAHVRSEGPGWWNILKTVKEDFDFLRTELKLDCYFVLLIGRDDRFVADGYIATNFATAPFLKQPGSAQTKYSVNEMQHLDRSQLILSVESIAKRLLSHKPRNDPYAP